jgi:hypothetical protein
VEQAHREVASKFSDWTPETFRKATDYAVSVGFNADQVKALNNPRELTLLRDAYYGSEARKRDIAAKKAISVEGVKPLSSVSGQSRSPNSAPSDRDSPEEWLRKRNLQLKRK